MDYSKFDGIVDSDDEKETSAKTKKVTKTAGGKCGNCHKAGVKLKACVCKKVSYCSTECQKRDWQYHRRTCSSKSGSSASATSAKPKPRPRPKTVDETAQQKKREEEDDDEDEPLTWYKHRETKLPPSASGPVKQVAAEASRPKAPSAGSAWNAAGTWEERDVLPWAKEKVTEVLVGLSRDFGQGAIVATEVKGVKGDASIGVVRGTVRRLCDVSLIVDFEARAGEHRLTGKVVISDLTHDLNEALEMKADLADSNPAPIAKLVRAHLGPPAATLPAKDDPPKTFIEDLAVALRRSFIPAFMALE